MTTRYIIEVNRDERTWQTCVWDYGNSHGELPAGTTETQARQMATERRRAYGPGGPPVRIRIEHVIDD